MLPHHLNNFDSFGMKYVPIEIRHFTGKTFLEYKYMIQLCAHSFALDLLTIWFQAKV